MILEVFDPTGCLEAAEPIPHAPRLATLDGKTICEISNNLWEDYRTFPLIRELLKKRFPGARFVPYTEFPKGTRDIDLDAIGDAVAAKGCDAVIGGNSA